MTGKIRMAGPNSFASSRLLILTLMLIRKLHTGSHQFHSALPLSYSARYQFGIFILAEVRIRHFKFCLVITCFPVSCLRSRTSSSRRRRASCSLCQSSPSFRVDSFARSSSSMAPYITAVYEVACFDLKKLLNRALQKGCVHRN